MAKNGAHGSGYLGVIQRESKIGVPPGSGWVERDISEGRFKNAKGSAWRNSLKYIPLEI